MHSEQTVTPTDTSDAATDSWDAVVDAPTGLDEGRHSYDAHQSRDDPDANIVSVADLQQKLSDEGLYDGTIIDMQPAEAPAEPDPVDDVLISELADEPVAAPTEQIDESAERDRISQALDESLQDMAAEAVAERKQMLYDSLEDGQNAEDFDMWQQVRESVYRDAYVRLDSLLEASQADLAKPDDAKDVFDRISDQVITDMTGSSEQGAGQDDPDFAAGAELRDLLGSDQLNDPAVIDKATRTINLLVSDGQYKLHRYGNDAQLATALDLMQAYAEAVPNFNPMDAGFDETKRGLTLSLAAIRLDQETKPDYDATQRSVLTTQISNGLTKIRATEASMYMRTSESPSA